MTDAHVVLGHVTRLAGGVRLDVEAAERAVGHLAGELGLATNETADGIIRVANAEMIRALRVVTVERGIDPRRYALLAFGGAGPLHAAAIADELGIDHVLVPRSSGVLAALGLVVAPQRRDVQRTVMVTDPSPEEVQALAGNGDTTYEVRYAGQSHELAVKADPSELRETFEAEHERRYGYRDPDRPIELVTIRVSSTTPGAEITLTGTAGPPNHGPTVIELPESTLLVPAGWTATVDDTGTTHLKR